MRRIPKHVLRTLGLDSRRAFKALKRRQVKNALRILRNEVTPGCAYSPAHYDICQAREHLDKAVQLQSEKNWGR